MATAVDYLKKNFLSGRESTRYAHLQPTAKRWLKTVANIRIHRETHARPDEVLSAGKKHLLSLPRAHYPAVQTRTVCASHDEELTREAVRRRWSHDEFLRPLIAAETQERQQHALVQRIKAARFPVTRTLGQFQ